MGAEAFDEGEGSVANADIFQPKDGSMDDLFGDHPSPELLLRDGVRLELEVSTASDCIIVYDCGVADFDVETAARILTEISTTKAIIEG